MLAKITTKSVKITTKPSDARKNTIESKRKRMKQMGSNFTWELVIYMARQTRNTHTRPPNTRANLH